MLGDSLRRRHAPRPHEPAEREPQRQRLRPDALVWWHWVLLGVGVLLLSFGIGYFAASRFLFPAPETAGAGVPVPELYGRSTGEAETLIREAGLATGATMQLTSAQVREGRVLAQDPVPGQQLRRGGEVRLVVSAGPPSPLVPAVTGLGQRAAAELLEELGFAVDVQQAPSTLPAGTVMRTEPDAGTRVRPPATAILIISIGPPRVDADTAPGAAQEDTARQGGT